MSGLLGCSIRGPKSQLYQASVGSSLPIFRHIVWTGEWQTSSSHTMTPKIQQTTGSCKRALRFTRLGYSMATLYSCKLMYQTTIKPLAKDKAPQMFAFY